VSNQVITKACSIAHLPATAEHLAVGAVLVSPTAALLAEVTAAGGTYRAAAVPNVNVREISGEAWCASNASG